MKSVGLIYWSGTDNTKQMADFLNEELQSAGFDVYFSEISEMDEEEFFSKDLLFMGSPACGTEQINEDYFEPLMEDNEDKFADKDVFTFGSYGWGGGEYMETWRELLEGYGANLVVEPVVCEGEPEDETFDDLKAVVQEL